MRRIKANKLVTLILSYGMEYKHLSDPDITYNNDYYDEYWARLAKHLKLKKRYVYFVKNLLDKGLIEPQELTQKLSTGGLYKLLKSAKITKPTHDVIK